MEVDPRSLPQADRYRLMIGAIVPRPIAIVGTRAPDGSSVNLAPFSFFAGVSSEPPALLFCPANTDSGGEKDSLRNAKPESEGGSGEFTVSVATDAIIARTAIAAEALPYGESEFELSGLTPAPSTIVRAPRVAESPVSFECRTRQVIRLAPGIPGAGNIVLGEIVRMHVDDSVLVRSERPGQDLALRIDPALLDAVGRMGGLGYARTRERFDLPWGADGLPGVPGLPGPSGPPGRPKLPARPGRPRSEGRGRP